MIKYLRFDTQAHAKLVLAEFVQNNEWLISSHTHSLDLIGPMVTDPAEVSDNGDIVAQAIIDDRFHINLQGYCQANVSAYEVFPTQPRRVWA